MTDKELLEEIGRLRVRGSMHDITKMERDAMFFAFAAHHAIDQRRNTWGRKGADGKRVKGDPFIVHPARVVNMLHGWGMSVPVVSDVEVAFGTTRFLPEWDSLPEEFRAGRAAPWTAMARALFFQGHAAGVEGTQGLVLKEGIEPEAVRRATAALLTSREPKHEHKMAGLAFLLSEWFERADG